VRVNVNVFLQFDHSLAGRHHIGHQRRGLVNGGTRADPHLSTWFDEAFPSSGGEAFQKKKFYLTVIGEFSGEDDTRVVQHKQIASLDEASDLGKARVLNRLISAMENHHARILTARQWAIRD
jgi:hypothetical protein